jgi:hypothetical protein
LYAPIAEAGVNFYTGPKAGSAAGALGYFLNFRAEPRKGFTRWHVAAQFDYASGKAWINNSQVSFTGYGAAFLPGVHFFAYSDGRFQPFFGGEAIVAWNYIKTPPPGTGANAPQTQGYGFGYELTVGVDMRLGSLEGNALRLRSGYWNVTNSNLAGASTFTFSGFRFCIGVVY